MFWISLLLMIAGFIGIIVCKKKQKTNPNAQALAFVFLILILIGAGGFLYDNLGGGEEKSLLASESRFAAAKSGKIAAEVKKIAAGKKVVVIIGTEHNTDEISKASLEAVKAALEGCTVVTEVLPLNNNSEEPVEMQINEKIYNPIFSNHKDAAAFVLMAQMPMDPKQIARLSIFSSSSKAKVALVSAEASEYGRYLQNGKVVAAVLSKTDKEALDYEKKAPTEPEAAFNVRYVLVTPANLKEVYGKYKNLFVR